MYRAGRLIVTLVLTLSGLSGGVSVSRAETTTLDDVITGAGAHFAWVVFDSLKDDLEHVTGKRVVLHGQHSALGVGCNAGIKLALQHSENDETFGFVCCPLSDKEVEEKGLIVYPIAIEPVLIVVHESNPVTNLTLEQVRAVFSGEITSWSEVGGPDEPIVVVTRLHCKKRPGHWKTILPDAKLFREPRLNVSSAAEMAKRVTAFPNSIGHIGSTWSFDKSDKVRSISIDGVAPTAENLANGRYPFFRNLSAVTGKNPSPDVLKVIKEVQEGPAIEKIAKQYQLLPAKK